MGNKHIFSNDSNQTMYLFYDDSLFCVKIKLYIYGYWNVVDIDTI